MYVSDMHLVSKVLNTDKAAVSGDLPDVVPAALMACDRSILLGSLCFEADSNARMRASFRRLILVS